MRRAGLYVSNISGADVEKIRAGGGKGGRVDEPEPISCWPSDVGGSFSVDAEGAYFDVIVDVACDMSIGSEDLNAVDAAAMPTQSVPWIPLDSADIQRLEVSGHSVEVSVTLYPNNNASVQRTGQLVWASSAPPGAVVSLSPVSVTQAAAPVSGSDSPITMICLEPSSSLPKRPGPCPDRVEVGSTVSLRAIVTPLPSGYVTAEVNGRKNGEIECSVGRTAKTCGWRISQLSGSGTPGRFVSGDSVNLTWRAPSSPGSVTIGARYQIYVQGVGGFFPIPEHWSDNKGHAAGSNTLTFDVIKPTPPPDLRPHLSCDNGAKDSEIDKNGTSCDSIDGDDVDVTLTVTRPNGTTVSSLLYTVEWNVRGGTHALSSSHPSSTTSRANHLLTWSSTGLTTGGQGVVTAAAKPNGYNHAFNSNQVTIIVTEKKVPPVVSEIACTSRVTPQEATPAGSACTVTLDAPGGGHIVDLSIEASDANDDPLTFIWRSDRGSFGARSSSKTTWSAAGLSPGVYPMNVTVAGDRFHENTERTVNVHVARYDPPVQELDDIPYVCTPDSGWKNGSGLPKVGDPYCGQFHDTHISNFRWFTTEVGARGASEVTLVSGGNSICGVAAGVCKEREDPWDSNYDPDDPKYDPNDEAYSPNYDDGNGNVYQWVNVYPRNP